MQQLDGQLVMTRKINKETKVSVGPSGSGALTSRFEGKGVWLRNLVFIGSLAFIVALAALIG